MTVILSIQAIKRLNKQPDRLFLPFKVFLLIYIQFKVFLVSSDFRITTYKRGILLLFSPFANKKRNGRQPRHVSILVNLTCVPRRRRRTWNRSARRSVAVMGGYRGYFPYFQEYLIILAHFYVYMCIYLYMYMYNAIFCSIFTHWSPKQ